ncbi:MAG: hypothetical protein HZC01_02710 [Candidatus Kerfeldbacteria bacterium]|nr:hypothetical protein [Candidatus Kerfeldbacteria bacterium]
MPLLSITIDVLNLVLAIAATLTMLMVVFRTSKRLDLAFKFFAATAISLLIAGLLRIDHYIGILPTGLIDLVLPISRTVALTFFILGSIIILLIIDKESR